MASRRSRCVVTSLIIASSEVALATASRAQQAASTTSSVENIETIIVTGSRIPRPNEKSPSPIQTVQPQSFTITGVANVEETINQLPQLVPGYTNTSNNPGTGAATLDLRGLGSVRTLILVNGRRWIANDAGAAPEVDVNTIPSALIKRVDVVSGGASAVYGSDAVTGVINFVLDDKVDGLHVAARNNITAKGDGRNTSADVSFGTSFLGGRGHVVASAGWLEQRPILQGDRVFSRFTLSDGCVVPGSRTKFGNSTPFNDQQCLPPNEIGFIAGGSSAIPSGLFGGLLPVPGDPSLLRPRQPITFNPDGSPRRFFFGRDAYNFAPANYLQVGFKRKSAIVTGSLEISPSFEPYTELTYVETISPQQAAPVPAFLGFGIGTVPFVRLNLDNPFLTPATVQILDRSYGVDAAGKRGFVVSPDGVFSVNPAFGGDADGMVRLPFLQSRLESLGPRQTVNRRIAKRGLFGVRGELSSRWSYDAFYSQSRVDHRVDYGNGASALRLQQALLARRDLATGAIVCIDPSNGCVPANVFGAGNLDPGVADFIRTHPRDKTVIEERVAEASLRGSVPLLKAGNLGLAAGVTWRRSSYDFKPAPSLFTGDELGFDPGTPASGSVSVWEVFGEARVPLLADTRGAYELTAELGARYSRYKIVGSVGTWKALMNWEPVRGFRLRGGIQHAVRAPNIRELFEAPTFNSSFVLDPCSRESTVATQPEIIAACVRNGVPVEVVGNVPLTDFAIGSFGGNIKLKPETATSITIGVALKPAAIPGLSLSLDYYDIRIKNAIATLGGGGIFQVSGCIIGGADPTDPLCQSYTRDTDGSILNIDQHRGNVPELRARGIDWQAAYGRDLPWSFGSRPDRIDLSLSGTYYLERSSTPNNRIGKLDCAGYFGIPCGNTVGAGATPRWKLLNDAAYTTGPITATLRHRWFSRTQDVREAVHQLTGAKAIFAASAEGRFLEARHYFDLALTGRVDKKFELTFGVNNLFDTKPAITGTLQVAANTDPSLYDVLGRRFFAVLKAKLP